MRKQFTTSKIRPVGFGLEPHWETSIAQTPQLSITPLHVWLREWWTNIVMSSPPAVDDTLQACFLSTVDRQLKILAQFVVLCTAQNSSYLVRRHMISGQTNDATYELLYVHAPAEFPCACRRLCAFCLSNLWQAMISYIQGGRKKVDHF